MSGIWKLFYHRRQLIGRDAEVDPGLSSASPDADLRGGPGHRHGGRRHYHSGDPHPRHPCHRHHRTERESVQSDHSISEYGAGIGQDGASASSRVGRSRLMRNDQLPGAVLQARARLLERLRGCSLARSRQGIVDSGITWDGFAVGDDFSFSNYVDSEAVEADTHRQQFNSIAPYIEFVHPAEQVPSFRDQSLENIPVVTFESLSSLHQEVFRSSGEKDGSTRGSLECCICLERFVEGDGLIRLNCAHRFHPACLKPWLQTIRNCPYCRASITC